MRDILPWVSLILAAATVVASYVSTREQLMHLREMLTAHRADAEKRDTAALAKLDALLAQHADISARVLVIEHQVAERGARSDASGVTLRAQVDALLARLNSLERDRPSKTPPRAR